MKSFLSAGLALLLLPAASLAAYANYDNTIPGGGYTWRGNARVPTDPSDEQLRDLAKTAYREMKSDVDYWRWDSRMLPSTMSVGFYPITGGGGDLIFHSSIKGGGTYTHNYINACDIGRHRYNGNCAEMANMVQARSYNWGLSTSKIAVYGTINSRGDTGFLSPCSNVPARGGGDLKGCRSYVDGVDATCVSRNGQYLKRDALAEPEPEAYAEPEAEPEPAKSKKSKSKDAGAHTKTAHSGSAHASATHSGSAHVSATQSFVPAHSGEPWAESCPIAKKINQKDLVKIDLSKLKGTSANEKMHSEHEIVAAMNKGFDTDKGKKGANPSIPKGKASGAPSVTGDSANASKTGKSAHASKTPSARSVQFPRRHLLGAMGF